jgi:hypothetical protein
MTVPQLRMTLPAPHPIQTAKRRLPFPKSINGKMSTGTKQLPGHLYRLLALLWQLFTPGRPVPIHFTEKNTPLKSTTGTGSQPFVSEKRSSSKSVRLRKAFVLEMRSSSKGVRPRKAFVLEKRSSSKGVRLRKAFVFERNGPPTFAAIVIVQSGPKLADILFVHP